MDLAMNGDAERTLRRFQEWQQMINPGDDSHPNHHDCAILMAKYVVVESISRESHRPSKDS